MWSTRHQLALVLFVLMGVALLWVPPQARSQGSQSVYLPFVSRPGLPSIYGFEAHSGAMGSSSQVVEQARQLGARWSRMNTVSWRAVQPNPGRSYNWGALAAFERDLAANVSLGLEPVVIVDDAPHWATVVPSSCAAIQDAYHAEFAAFMEALVNRYKSWVRYWELGNEPDIDPSLVPTDNLFGCWGDIDDPYYGGERYGRMLRAVAPAIRRADPSAQIVIGGLLLDSPNTTAPGRGQPSAFFEGILRAGAAGSFDIVAYHAYPSYPNQQIDYDLEAGNGWKPYGGWTVGKARFLRDVMRRYGVSKPLWLNETSLLCTVPYAQCTPPTAAFFQAQADHLVRVLSRAAAEDVQQVIWYTLNGPGWRSSSLLDGGQQPRPAYTTYQHFIRRVGQYYSATPVTYSADTEAYRFDKGNLVIDVVWSRSSAVRTIEVPSGRFLAAYSRDGAPLTPRLGVSASLDVGFAPIFIQRLR